ncbi:hypothetical protein HDF12_003790 [Edaphobacter lichenicola]|uniref:Uncharacterized protein n=1 Tax=Tunturiibacter lichenicola TaxID=2051959 RepID=A0A7Y9NQ04_9BACT|nr:hypothetical protein [Edaphobacter lichenicola]
MQMKRSWKNPVRRAASDATLKTEGDFEKFTDFMRKIVAVNPAKKDKQPTPASSSPGPAAS